MIYKKDNRQNRYKNKYIALGIILGVGLTVVGFYVYDNYKQPILDNVNQIKNTALSEIPKTNLNPQTSNPQPVQDNSGSSQNTPSITSTQSQQPSSTASEIQPSLVNTIDLEHAIHDQINVIRVSAGLRALTYDEQVATMARAHSQDMAINNYFDHTSPDGKTLQDRIITARIPCFPDGENIEQTNTGDTPDSIVQTWMNSQGHRDNILSPIYMRDGIGVYSSLGNEFITDDFC